MKIIQHQKRGYSFNFEWMKCDKIRNCSSLRKKKTKKRAYKIHVKK